MNRHNVTIIVVLMGILSNIACRKSEDRDTDDTANDTANFSSVDKDKVVAGPIRVDGMLVDPSFQKFDDPNNSPLSVFRQFRSALLADDLDKVVSCFVSYKQAVYAEFYKKLRPYFQKMAEDMKGLALKSRRENIVECELLRQEGDSISAYPIIFVKDEDGNWWIQEL